MGKSQVQQDVQEYDKPENVKKRFQSSGNMDPEGDKRELALLDEYEDSLKGGTGNKDNRGYEGRG